MNFLSDAQHTWSKQGLGFSTESSGLHPGPDVTRSVVYASLS